MRRGLIIGKFMPLHKGHTALIRFASGQCDEVIVSMTFKKDDPIPGPLRFEWLREEFKHELKIKISIHEDDFDQESLSWPERIPLWSDFLKKHIPPIQFIYSSEEYGPLLANEMKVHHNTFDLKRVKYPVSGTMVRQQPLKYWDLIAAPARSYFVKKICFYGPESTGKSTMAKKLAELYHTEFVPEVSREIVTTNTFTVEDIIKIGYAQTERVLSQTKKANKILFCDSDLITTQIYCDHYLKVIPPVLIELEAMVKYDHYYFFDIDVPWVADEIRDLGDRREEMLQVFKNELDSRKILYTWVRGSHDEREKFLRNEMDRVLLN